MDEIWERAVEAALDGQTDVSSVRSLTLDGAVKCLHGRLPQPSLFEKFHSLQHFSIANIGVSSLEQFPHLRNLQRLILSDNRIAGGLEFLVEAGLGSLRDLDLSNNRISDINDLRPLAELRLVSLDLYECPVTRIKDYRAQVFGLIRSLKYLDKMDVDENERPESEDEEEDEEEEDDPGSGEVDGEDHPFRLNNGDQAGIEGVVDVDEDEESDADEEETETPRVVDGLSRSGRDSHPHSNGFGVVAVDGEDDDDDDDEGEEDDDLVEVYEDDEGEDEDVVEVHEIDDSEDEDGVEYDEDEDDDEDEEEEVNNDERDFGEAGGAGRLTSTEGEIDGHEQGDDDADEDDNGETGEEEQAVEEDGDFDDEDEEEDSDNGYLVQPVERAEPQTGGSDMDPGDEDEDPEIEEDLEDDDEEDLDGEIQELPSSSSHKRKRNEESHDDDDDDVCEDGDEDEDGDDDGDDDMRPNSKSSKHH